MSPSSISQRLYSGTMLAETPSARVMRVFTPVDGHSVPEVIWLRCPPLLHHPVVTVHMPRSAYLRGTGMRGNPRRVYHMGQSAAGVGATPVVPHAHFVEVDFYMARFVMSNPP